MQSCKGQENYGLLKNYVTISSKELHCLDLVASIWELKQKYYTTLITILFNSYISNKILFLKISFLPQLTTISSQDFVFHEASYLLN